MDTDRTAPIDCGRVTVADNSDSTSTAIRSTPRPAAPARSRRSWTRPRRREQPASNLRGVFAASYTDEQAGGLPPLGGSDEMVPDAACVTDRDARLGASPKHRPKPHPVLNGARQE